MLFRSVRRWLYTLDFETIHDNDGHLETREVLGQWQAELHNTDVATINYSRVYDFLPEPFLISRGVRLPVGGYDYGQMAVTYAAGQQRAVSGTISAEVGSFYGGDRQSVTFKGRIAMTNQLGIEPNIALNWIDLPQGRFTDRIVGGRTTFTASPRMFVAALIQYS